MADQNDDIITQVQERVAAEAAQTATPEKNQIDSEFVMKCLHDNSVGDGRLSVFIHDGKSKGTSNEVKLADKMGVPYTYYKLPRTNYKTSVGFDIEVPWDEIELDLEGIDE